MIYPQQTILDTTIAPIPQRRRKSAKQQERSVAFCESTMDAPERQPGSMKRPASSSVPIPDAMLRSPSELQLSVDEQVADERDYVFYSRIMSGIQERNRYHPCDPNFSHYNRETEKCLTHIMQTRHQHGQQQQQHQYQGINDNGDYFIEDLDYAYPTSSSNSYSSTPTYQQEFEPDRSSNDVTQPEECMFDLELWQIRWFHYSVFWAIFVKTLYFCPGDNPSVLAVLFQSVSNQHPSTYTTELLLQQPRPC